MRRKREHSTVGHSTVRKRSEQNVYCDVRKNRTKLEPVPLRSVIQTKGACTHSEIHILRFVHAPKVRKTEAPNPKAGSASKPKTKHVPRRG